MSTCSWCHALENIALMLNPVRGGKPETNPEESQANANCGIFYLKQSCPVLFQNVSAVRDKES